MRSEELKSSEPESHKMLRLKDLLYNIGRSSIFCDDRAVSVPPWTIFQSKVEEDILTSAATVVFNPILMSSPTDISTVYTTLKRAKEQVNALGQNICPIVFDMGLLSKALEVVWAKPKEFEGVIPLEGGMHFLMSCFAGIGFVYGELGLKELLYESDVFAKNTAEHILSGKDFDRALRAVLIVDEALNGRFFANFKKWLEQRNETISEEMRNEISSCFDDLADDDTELLSTVLGEIDSNICPLIEQFRIEGREASPLFQFWDDYLTKVSEPIKLYLASSRHSMWESNHYSKWKLLPFFFAANRSTYARYMTYMLLSENRLPEKVIRSFSNGNFVAKLTDGTFNGVWLDYVLEVTENKSLKTTGGIIGITHNENALIRWFLSRPVTARYSMAFSGNGPDHQQAEKRHHTDNKSFKDSFNSDVSKMCEMFEETFIDPFSITNPSARLVNFATGVTLPEDTEFNLLNVHKEGEAMLEKFVTDRFVIPDGESMPRKSFYDPLPKSKVAATKSRTSKIKCKSKDVEIGGEEMYIRLLAINSFKKVPLERVMSFENAPVPLSLFDDSGKMIANKKSDFMEKLETLISPNLILKALSGVDCIIFDGMAVIQMLKPVTSLVKPTFSDLANMFWTHILHSSEGINVVHVVFDRYFENSIKTQTREKRGDQSLMTANIQPHMKALDWKKLLTSSKSKSHLTKFYTRYFCEQAQNLLTDSQSMFISGGLDDKVVQVTHDCVRYSHDLNSNQEEADTRMMLHVQYSGNRNANRVVLVSPDTDVLVLLIHHFSELGVSELYFKTGRTSIYANYTRFIPVHQLCENMTEEQRHVLLSVYCLTGCDSCSALFSIGKKKVFNAMIGNAEDIRLIATMGTDENLPTQVKQVCVKFVGMLYGAVNCASLNKLRTEKVLKNKNVKPKKLPPTDDSFLLHMLRCTYQLLVWKGCLSAMRQLPDPLEFGYVIDRESSLMIPQLMSQSVTPPELLSDLVCDCTDMCENNCICVLNEQPCTHACECKGNVEDSEICMHIFTTLASVP